MAPASRFGLRNYGAGGSNRPPAPGGNVHATTGGNAVPPAPRTVKMSKAERLLGVADTSGMNAQIPKPTSDAGKRAQRRGARGLTSAFSDLKGALSGATRYAATRGRRTPNSPGIFPAPTDSDSVTSVTSPTFDTSTSASTMPSYFEPPHSPYFSQRGSESPSSPRDVDARLEYHAALHEERYKGAMDMPSISERFILPSGNLQPPHRPPLSPLSKPGTPKSSFSPINRLRSPSTLSVASESTAKARLFGRRSSKNLSKEMFLDYPFTPSYEHQLPINHVPIPPMPTTKADSAAIEQWLSRADLARRPSNVSTATRSTMHRSNSQAPLRSAASSIKTTTTRRETSSPPPPVPPILRAVQSSDELDNFAIARQQPSFRNGPDLQIQSVLSLSSSEDEDSDDERLKRPLGGKAEGRGSTDTPSLKMQRTASFSSAATTAPQILEMQRQAIIQKRSQKKGFKRQMQPIVTPPASDIGKTAFGSIDWREENEDEGDTFGLDTLKTETDTVDLQSHQGRTRKVDSTTLSPTSKVMVVSKKEEKLLAQIRDGKRYTNRLSMTDSESTTSTSAPPIISVSPPRRPKRNKATDGVEEMLELSENRVITFPTPPTLPMIGASNSRVGSMSLSLSREVLSELSGLPDGPGSTEDPPPLPTGTIIASGTVSHDNKTIVQASPQDRVDGPPLPPAPQELQGSMPDLQSALRADIDQRREKRRTPAVLHGTGRESRHSDLLSQIEGDEDLRRYVMAAVI